MSTSTAERRDVRGLLRWMFLGRPPSKPPGGVNLTLTLLGFPIWCSWMALTWGAIPPLVTLAFVGMGLSGVLATLGSLASYHRWRGDRPGELLRLASHLPATASVALFLAHLVPTKAEWVWWSAFVLTLAIVVAAGYYYGPNGGPDAEGKSSAGGGPGS